MLFLNALMQDGILFSFLFINPKSIFYLALQPQVNCQIPSQAGL